MAADTRADDFERGIELFNAGRFFEAHEAWERVWLRSAGEEKLFYQGLIQAAAALLHAERGNLIGARSMYAKARLKLDPLPEEYHRIALGSLRLALGEFFLQIPAGGASRARIAILRLNPNFNRSRSDGSN